MKKKIQALILTLCVRIAFPQCDVHLIPDTK